MALPSYPKTSTARAPGSLMIMGEYAVLGGYPAIVTAIDQYIHVTLTSREDQNWVIHSALGTLTMNKNALIVQAPFEYVLTTLKLHGALQTGLTIDVQNDFPSTYGLGSSAAVTVALCLALHRLHESSIDAHALHREALNIVRQVQQGGSGADVAASIFGGTLLYRAEPLTISPLPPMPPLCVVYSGQKTTTTQALAAFKRQKQADPERYQRFIEALGTLSQSAHTAILESNWPRFGDLMNQAQNVLKAGGVSTPAIDHIIHVLQQEATLWGAKISGAGLGDCVIGLGPVAQGRLPGQLSLTTGARGGFSCTPKP